MDRVYSLVPVGYSDWGVVLSVGILFATTSIAGCASGIGQSDVWFQNLVHPQIAPPPRLSNIITYGTCVLFGVASYDVWAWAEGRFRDPAIALYVLLVVFSVAGPFAFFVAHALRLSSVLRALHLLAAASATGVYFAASTLAGGLMVPVAAWSLFDYIVSIGYVRLNGEGRAGQGVTLV